MKTLCFKLRGTVQGVGFRPWVFRLAKELLLKGFVKNTSSGAVIEVEGGEHGLARFSEALTSRLPVHCAIFECVKTELPFHGFHDFIIASSDVGLSPDAIVLPDMATCPECMKELFDRGDRRYLYPFINCTHCGPRYSIIESLPYDRFNTSMKAFTMCKECQAEYDDPTNRRFHAEPNACPHCGPQVQLLDTQGKEMFTRGNAIREAGRVLKEGHVVAFKALGGFQLLVDASNTKAVALLRQRKHRPHKAFAVLMDSVAMVDWYCHMTPEEKEALTSSQAPIVLLKKRIGSLGLAESIAPDNPYLGCMLPAMPLQHVLMKACGGPLVATSANLSEEPICIDNDEALRRLRGIADFFLVHDRPIVRHVDDSVVQVISRVPQVLRRARGYAPLPIELGEECNGILAVGAQQKNAVALGVGTTALVSQHIGDLDSPLSIKAFEETIHRLRSIYHAPLKKVACDLHMDYVSTNFAKELDVPFVLVQHHHAHVASCMAEWGLEGKVLGVCWDGTGYGVDGTIWGGEFLEVEGASFKRFAHLKTFCLLGGDKAVKEPRRSALACLYMLGDESWEKYKRLPCFNGISPVELSVINRMLKHRVNCLLTSSMGRLFDAVASITGLYQSVTFEGQAAMALEFAAADEIGEAYPYEVLAAGNDLSIDWSEILKKIVRDVQNRVPVKTIAARFHQTLVDIIVDIAQRSGTKDVVLTGGCFQNRRLTESAIARLFEEGFRPYWHRAVPPNDGGIALGQMRIAARSS